MHEPPRHFIELAPGVSMAFRLIPPDEFRMGQRGELADEEPVHRVRIAHPFWMAETPVRQEQFAVWARAAGVAHENHFQGRPRHPAESMDWDEATAFCDWVTERCRAQFPEGMQRAALPSEVQWEYACRAGTETEYHTGDGEAALREAGWYNGNSASQTHPVGEKSPNAFGLFDMHGNVWEWCADLWDDRLHCKRADGSIADLAIEATDRADNHPHRVVRGGSWFNSARNCRSAIRYRHTAVPRYWFNGFRPVLVSGPVAQDERSEGNEGKAEPATRDGGRGTNPESPGAGGAIELSKERIPRSGRKLFN